MGSQPVKLGPLESVGEAEFSRSSSSLGGMKVALSGCLGEIPLVVLTMHIGPLLSSAELLSLCVAQPKLWDYGPEIAGWLAFLQHGLDRSSVTHIKQLTELEGIPKSRFFDFASPSFLKDEHVRLLRGSLLAYPIYVGSTHDAITTAINPPACGDAWEVTVELQRGCYQATVVGWRNPFHGILDLWLDDQLVSGSSGLDCFSPETAELHRFPPIEIEIQQTGWHTWCFETSRSHGMSQQYWMCLEEFRVDRIGSPASDRDLPPVAMESPKPPTPPRRPTTSKALRSMQQ